MAFTAAGTIESAIDSSMNVAYGALPGLMTGIGAIAGTGVSLYFVMTMLSYIWTGQAAQIPAMDLFKRFFFLVLVCTFAFNTSTYLDYVKDPVLNIPNDVSQLVSNQNLTSASTIDGMMDDNVNLVNEIVSAFSEMGILDFNISLFFESLLAIIVIMGLGTIYVIIAFCYLMIAKVLVHVCLLLGPIFIMFAFFPMTREYFGKWVGQLLNYIILAVLFTAVFALLNNVLTSIVGGGLTSAGFFGLHTGTMVWPMFFTYLLFIGVILAIPSLASSLTGGVGVSPFAQVAQLAGGAGRGASSLLGGGVRRPVASGVTDSIKRGAKLG